MKKKLFQQAENKSNKIKIENLDFNDGTYSVCRK